MSLFIPQLELQSRVESSNTIDANDVVSFMEEVAVVVSLSVSHAQDSRRVAEIGKCRPFTGPAYFGDDVPIRCGSRLMVNFAPRRADF
jgi:hypothetical protein